MGEGKARRRLEEQKEGRRETGTGTLAVKNQLSAAVTRSALLSSLKGRKADEHIALHSIHTKLLQTLFPHLLTVYTCMHIYVYPHVYTHALHLFNLGVTSFLHILKNKDKLCSSV